MRVRYPGARIPIPSARLAGFSLVELLLVLGVTALLAIAAFVIYGFVSASVQANDETQRLYGIAANINSSLGMYRDYSGFGSGYPGSGSVNQAAYAFLQKPYGATSTTVTNRWGGKVYLNMYRDGYNMGNGPNGIWVLVEYNIPADVCPKLLANLAAPNSPFIGVATTSLQYASSFGWVQLSDRAWSGMSAVYGPGTKKSSIVALSPDQWATACQNLTSGNPSQMGIAIFGGY